MWLNTITRKTKCCIFNNFVKTAVTTPFCLNLIYVAEEFSFKSYSYFLIFKSVILSESFILVGWLAFLYVFCSVRLFNF